jgi:hypothetical protein
MFYSGASFLWQNTLFFSPDDRHGEFSLAVSHYLTSGQDFQACAQYHITLKLLQLSTSLNFLFVFR